MQRILFILFLVVAGYGLFNEVTAYRRFKSDYKKPVGSVIQELNRFYIFLNCRAWVMDHQTMNLITGNPSLPTDLNEFADVSYEDFVKRAWELNTFTVLNQ